MKHNHTSVRIISCFCTLLLLGVNCRKIDHINKPCCPLGPLCDVQTLLISAGDSMSHGVTYPEPYRFHKTYGPDGRANYIDVFFGPGWSYHRFTCTLSYKKNYVYGVNAQGDTVLRITLDACGQALSAQADQGNGASNTRYEYDNKGRMVKFTYDYFPYFPPEAIIYEYDQYGNVTRLYYETDSTYNIKYTYDYSKPIKGGLYEQEIQFAMGSYLLEYLGYLNTQPHHQLIAVSNNWDYPEGTWSYTQQVVDKNGYLLSYRANLYDNQYAAMKADLVWNCGKSHDHNRPTY